MTKIKWFCLLGVILILSCSPPVAEKANTVNDVTHLNAIKVRGVIAPASTGEISSIIQQEKGPISIGGGRYSMGGQTATFQALQIDMRKFNKIVNFSQDKKEITVQPGIRWRELIKFIDRYNLSVSIMQSYANFTVGGSLSVNVHGRYLGQGAIISSVKQIKVVLANGKLVTASPTVNSELFNACIGGYGGIAVIVEVTLKLTTNEKIERRDTVLNLSDYSNYFQLNIKNHKTIVFHNGIIYPNNYDKVRAVSHIKTTKALTIKDRIKPVDSQLLLNRIAMNFVSGSDFGKWVRRVMLDPLFFSKDYVVWRNYEATFDVSELEPKSRNKETYVLQEYFVPVNRFNEFYPKMVHVLKQHDVNVLNVSIRHAVKDSLSTMAWARTEVFAFVVYYKQAVDVKARNKVKMWTQALIAETIGVEGSYYLPYQIHATEQQFLKAYPNASSFFKLKRKYDPTYKFRNKLFDAYYRAQLPIDEYPEPNR